MSSRSNVFLVGWKKNPTNISVIELPDKKWEKCLEIANGLAKSEGFKQFAVEECYQCLTIISHSDYILLDPFGSYAESRFRAKHDALYRNVFIFNTASYELEKIDAVRADIV